MMFAKRVTQYLGRPFRKGGKSQEGYDCLGFVSTFLKDMGKNFPFEHGEWNLDNYSDFYTTDIEAAEAYMCEAFHTIGNEVKPERALAGDLIVVRHQNGRLFPAIYCGNGNAIASFLRAGVRVFALKDGNKIVLARRL